MYLLEEIRECFASKEKGAIKLKSLQVPYIGWYVRTEEGYGVAVPCSSEVEVSEYFANSKIQTRDMIINAEEVYVLLLSCINDDFAYEFASVCAEFLEPGKNGIARAGLINDPVSWWKRWKELMGNSARDKKVYDVIGEMLVYEHLLKSGKSVVWGGPDAKTHDIESDDESFEIKSTIRKYGYTTTISSQYQMESDKPLSLYFCRLEKSRLGDSINDIKERLLLLGCNDCEIEKKLSGLGLEKGRSIRNEKYKILEALAYPVDDKFPKVIRESFKDNQYPERVLQITYTINLEGLENKKW